MPGLVLVGGIGWVRPRPDQAHVSSQDIEQLWQFVQTRHAKPPAGPKDPRIVRTIQLRQGTVHIDFSDDLIPMHGSVRIDPHGAKFPDAEFLPKVTDAPLGKEHRPGGGDLNEKDYEEKEWKQADHERCRKENIEHPLPGRNPPAQQRRNAGPK
jgi:hypothetical protein